MRPTTLSLTCASSHFSSASRFMSCFLFITLPLLRNTNSIGILRLARIRFSSVASYCLCDIHLFPRTATATAQFSCPPYSFEPIEMRNASSSSHMKYCTNFHHFLFTFIIHLTTTSANYAQIWKLNKCPTYSPLCSAFVHLRLLNYLCRGIKKRDNTVRKRLKERYDYQRKII